VAANGRSSNVRNDLKRLQHADPAPFIDEKNIPAISQNSASELGDLPAERRPGDPQHGGGAG
jgi:hypothetical protein